LLLMLFGSVGARAQGVIFTNGDHLSGTWVEVTGTTIEFNSNMMGKLAIPEAKVSSFGIAQKVVVLLQNGQSVPATQAEFADGAWTIESEGKAQSIPAGEIAAIIPAPEYHVVVREGGAKIWRGWRGGATFGYSLQHGDQDARTVSVGLNAVRRLPGLAGLSDRWRTTYSFNLLFANAQSAGQQISSNTFTTALRQDYFFQPQNFLFALGQVDHIQTQNLNLRQTYGGGFGRDLLETPRVKFSLLGGATFSNQKFVATPAEQLAEGLAGEHLTLAVNRQIAFGHSLTVYPNFSTLGQYRFDTSSSLMFHLNSWLSANLGATDFYISQIPPGSATSVTTIGPGGTLITSILPAHKNNLTVTAGVGLNF
jgi:putative salt-induced outer membrane protein YdiY